MQRKEVQVIGAGLAGSEASFFLAQQGTFVHLYEMRPKASTPAHKTDRCAELVCSNSLKSEVPNSAPGLLKNEMRQMESLVLQAATKSRVPGGDALTVDRDVFSEHITSTLSQHPHIEIHREECTQPSPDIPTLIATGPLTSDSLTQWLCQQTGEENLYFYDAIAPIVDASTIDRTRVFECNRYEHGDEPAYLNCPMNQSQYESFVDSLLRAETVQLKPFEKEKYFQGCQPIEAIAASGRDSLRFGPMRPVGLNHPVTGEKYYAVVQLRPENLSKTAYNLVGFQTKLKYPEQGRILRMIPGLEKVEFLRFGSIHRNTYLCSPQALRPDLSLKGNPNTYVAGQITGVEGYLESAACGLLAALFVSQRLQGLMHNPPPANTALGSLLHYILFSDPKRFQPTNIHFGLWNPVFFRGLEGLKKDELRKQLVSQTQEAFSAWWKSFHPAQDPENYRESTFSERATESAYDPSDRAQSRADFAF